MAYTPEWVEDEGTLSPSWDNGNVDTPTWGSQTGTSFDWTVRSDASAIGNYNRMVGATDIADGTGGVDFNNKFEIENSWAFTSDSPIAFYNTNRNDPV